MHLDGAVNLLMQLLAALHIGRREPAAHSPGLEVGIQPLGKKLVFAGIADEAGVELNRSAHRADEVNKIVAHARATQENVWNPALRARKGVSADRRRAVVLYCLQSLGLAKIYVRKGRA